MEYTTGVTTTTSSYYTTEFISPGASAFSSTASMLHQTHVGAIVGGVIGGMVLLAALIGLLFWCRRRRREPIIGAWWSAQLEYLLTRTTLQLKRLLLHPLAHGEISTRHHRNLSTTCGRNLRFAVSHRRPHLSTEVVACQFRNKATRTQHRGCHSPSRHHHEHMRHLLLMGLTTSVVASQASCRGVQQL